MYTINAKANKEIEKAQKALRNALDILSEEKAYNDKSEIYHATTVADVNKIVTAIISIRE